MDTNEKIADQLFLNNLLHIMENNELVKELGISSNEEKELYKTARIVLKRYVKLNDYESEKRKSLK